MKSGGNLYNWGNGFILPPPPKVANPIFPASNPPPPSVLTSWPNRGMASPWGRGSMGDRRRGGGVVGGVAGSGDPRGHPEGDLLPDHDVVGAKRTVDLHRQPPPPREIYDGRKIRMGERVAACQREANGGKVACAELRTTMRPSGSTSAVTVSPTGPWAMTPPLPSDSSWPGPVRSNARLSSSPPHPSMGVCVGAPHMKEIFPPG